MTVGSVEVEGMAGVVVLGLVAASDTVAGLVAGSERAEGSVGA